MKMVIKRIKYVLHLVIYNQKPRKDNWKPCNKCKGEGNERKMQAKQTRILSKRVIIRTTGVGKRSNFEEILTKLVEAFVKRHRQTKDLMRKIVAKTYTTLKTHQASILQMKGQVGKISQVLQECFPETFPIFTKKNPNVG